jgi:peptidoglycan/xylan/chitin deacetylase (PgdA/CDA1 family)
MSATAFAKHAAKGLLASSAGWRASALLRNRGTVALMYHRINGADRRFPGMPVEQFREQMRWIRTNCTPVAAEDTLEAARMGGRIRPPVVITFDDGFRDYHDLAYPILRELRIPAAMFLSTDFMDRGGMLWGDVLHWAVSSSPRDDVRLPWLPDTALSLASKEARNACIRESKAHLKGIPDAQRRALLAEFVARLEAPDPDSALDRQMLSWDEVRATREGTTYGGHSHTHPILSQLEAPEMEFEIRTCSERIRAELGEAPRCFAYPNGRAVDFNATTRELLRRHGFTIAFSTIEGINGPDADVLALRRQAGGGTTLGDFATLVARA